MFQTKKFCRICTHDGCLLIDLSALDTDNIKFSEKLKYCVKEAIIENELLPDFICETCCYNLKISFSFKKNCLNTQSIISHVLNNENCNTNTSLELKNEKINIKEEPISDEEEELTIEVSEKVKNIKSDEKNCVKCQDQSPNSDMKSTSTFKTFSNSEKLNGYCQEDQHKTGLPITDEIEISYVCSICHFRYPYERLLVAHMRAHSGERPFKCNLCNERFSWQHHLKRHMQQHEVGKRTSFPCTVCSKKFPNVAKLQMHMRQHSRRKSSEEVEDQRELRTRNGCFERYSY